MLALNRRIEKLEAQAGTVADDQEAQRLHDYFNPPPLTAEQEAYVASLSPDDVARLTFNWLASMEDRPPTPANHSPTCWCDFCQRAREWDTIARMTDAEAATWWEAPFNLDWGWPTKSAMNTRDVGKVWPPFGEVVGLTYPTGKTAWLDKVWSGNDG